MNTRFNPYALFHCLIRNQSHSHILLSSLPPATFFPKLRLDSKLTSLALLQLPICLPYHLHPLKLPNVILSHPSLPSRLLPLMPCVSPCRPFYHTAIFPVSVHKPSWSSLPSDARRLIASPAGRLQVGSHGVSGQSFPALPRTWSVFHTSSTLPTVPCRGEWFSN